MPQNLICRHTVGAVAAQPDRRPEAQRWVLGESVRGPHESSGGRVKDTQVKTEFYPAAWPLTTTQQ